MFVAKGRYMQLYELRKLFTVFEPRLTNGNFLTAILLVKKLGTKNYAFSYF